MGRVVAYLSILILGGTCLVFEIGDDTSRKSRPMNAFCILTWRSECVQGWVQQWLKYVHWYPKVGLSTDLSL